MMNKGKLITLGFSIGLLMIIGYWALMQTQEDCQVFVDNEEIAGSKELAGEKTDKIAVICEKADIKADTKESITAEEEKLKDENIANENTAGVVDIEPVIVFFVNVAIVGKSNNLLYINDQLIIAESNKWGNTPLGVLEATTLNYEVSTTFGGFVTGIESYSNQGMSGWMYKVNNQVPMVGADQYQLNADDIVIWWYSECISNPGPSWDQVSGEHAH